MDSKNLLAFFRLSRPWLIIGTALLYGLGAGIANYLGITINWGLYWAGQGWITLVQLSMVYLIDYFADASKALPTSQSPGSENSGALQSANLPREIALWSGLVCLTMAGPLSVLLIQDTQRSISIIFTLLLIFLAALAYAIPPVRLIATGYGELVISVLAACMVPALAFLLQYNEFHRLLAMTTFPLAALHLAMLLAFELPGYAADLKQSRKNLMIQMGWERGMHLHNILILSAFSIFGFSLLAGLPWRIALPSLLAAPLGFIQIWMMRNIAEGGRPNWKALSLMAIAVFGVTAYLLLFAYWTN